MRRAILSVMIVLVTAATASAQRTVFVVRHADYDNLFVVTLRDKPTLLRLHYR